MAERAPDYKGVPLCDLAIDAVHWTPERIEHLANRAARKGRSEVSIEVEWATEAALDPDRLVALASEPDRPENQALKVIGFSPSMPPGGSILKVWIWSDDPAGSTEWNGGSAALSGGSARRAYESAKQGRSTT